MLYIGYFIILDGQSIKKNSVSKITIFELPRLENCMSRLCPRPLPPPPPRHPNGVKNTQRGSKHALHRIFDHFGWSEYQKKSF